MLVAIALVALAIVIWRISDAFVVAFGGIVLAALTRALADGLHRVTAIRDRWCVLIVVIAFGSLVVGLVWLFGQQATKQATELREQLPAAFHKAMDAVQRTDTGRTVVASIRDGAGRGTALSNAGIAASAVLTAVVDAILILFVSVYFALDVPLYRDGALRLLPPRFRTRCQGSVKTSHVGSIQNQPL